MKLSPPIPLWLSLLVALSAGCGTASRQQVPNGPARVDRSIIHKQLPAQADRAAYRQMFESASDWQRKAAEINGEWRDVAPLLEQAEAAAAAGDLSRAIELAEHARFQAEMGYRQMKAQRDVTHPAFLYF